METFDTNNVNGSVPSKGAKNETLSIKTTCPIATVSSESVKAETGEVLFCCGTFDETGKNKLYFSRFNGANKSLKAVVAVDHLLPPARIIFNPSEQRDEQNLIISTGSDVIIWKYGLTESPSNASAANSELSVRCEVSFASLHQIDSPSISACWNREDTNLLATGSVNGKISLWDLTKTEEVSGTSGKPKADLMALIALQKREIYDLTFRPRSKSDLFIAGRDGTIKFMDIRKPDQFHLCFKQSDNTPVVKAAFNEHNNNQLAFSTSESNFVSVLDLRWSSQPYAYFQTEARVNAFHWSPKGSAFASHIATGSVDGVVSIWDSSSPLATGVSMYPAMNCKVGKGIWDILWFPTDPNFVGIATEYGFQILQI